MPRFVTDRPNTEVRRDVTGVVNAPPRTSVCLAAALATSAGIDALDYRIVDRIPNSDYLLGRGGYWRIGGIQMIPLVPVAVFVPTLRIDVGDIASMATITAPRSGDLVAELVIHEHQRCAFYLSWNGAPDMKAEIPIQVVIASVFEHRR